MTSPENQTQELQASLRLSAKALPFAERVKEAKRFAIRTLNEDGYLPRFSDAPKLGQFIAQKVAAEVFHYTPMRINVEELNVVLAAAKEGDYIADQTLRLVLAAAQKHNCVQPTALVGYAAVLEQNAIKPTYRKNSRPDNPMRDDLTVWMVGFIEQHWAISPSRSDERKEHSKPPPACGASIVADCFTHMAKELIEEASNLKRQRETLSYERVIGIWKQRKKPAKYKPSIRWSNKF